MAPAPLAGQEAQRPVAGSRELTVRLEEEEEEEEAGGVSTAVFQDDVFSLRWFIITTLREDRVAATG